MSEIKLPKDWKAVKLNEICDKISLNKIKIKQKQYLPEGKYPVIDQGQDLIGGYFNDEKLIVPNEPPYIIFGDHTKVKKFINFKFIPGADGVKVIKPKKNIDPKFLFYSLFTIKIEDKGYARHFQLLEKELFPLAPPETQQAIVSKIEELFSDLDKGIEDLKTALQQLKTYRQSVLKWAFEGKLTNVNVKDGVLPKGWEVVEIIDLLESVRNGYSKKPDDTGKIKILRISSVRPGKINLNDVRFLEKNINQENSIQENDLLFTRYNGSIDYVGVCARVPQIREVYYYPDKLIRCRPIIKESFHSKYLEYSVNYGESRNFVLSKIKTTAGQNGISGSEIKQVPIILAPLKEQHQIVQEIESRLSIADKMEESIAQSLVQAEALRQSILKKAFSGELV